MNRFAAAHPEDWEDRLEAYTDGVYRQAEEKQPCRVCGDVLTRGGRTCKRCEASLEEDKWAR
jgi:hypothetical protein